MKWDMDATLPIERRYTSMKFKRVAPRLVASRLDYGDATELVAFIRTLGPVRHSAKIFQWPAWVVPEADALLKHLSDDPQVAQMVHENNEALTRDDGLAVLKAMQDGGWRGGGVPNVVRLALLDMRDAGLSARRVGLATALSVDQVFDITNNRWGRRKRAWAARSRRVAGLVAG